MRNCHFNYDAFPWPTAVTEISRESSGYCSVFNVLYRSVIKKNQNLWITNFINFTNYFQHFLIKYVRWHASDIHILSLEVRDDKIHSSQLTKKRSVLFFEYLIICCIWVCKSSHCYYYSLLFCFEFLGLGFFALELHLPKSWMYVSHSQCWEELQD